MPDVMAEPTSRAHLITSRDEALKQAHRLARENASQKHEIEELKAALDHSRAEARASAQALRLSHDVRLELADWQRRVGGALGTAETIEGLGWICRDADETVDYIEYLHAETRELHEAFSTESEQLTSLTEKLSDADETIERQREELAEKDCRIQELEWEK